MTSTAESAVFELRHSHLVRLNSTPFLQLTASLVFGILMCLHPINNKNQFLAILFFSFSFHSDVRQNTEENICCYLYFISTLIVNPYNLYLNLLSNILFVSTIYIQEFKGNIIWLLNGSKPCYQIITSLANTKLWKEFCVLMSHGAHVSDASSSLVMIPFSLSHVTYLCFCPKDKI